MTAYTNLSAKGQVVMPKAVRDRLGWVAGSFGRGPHEHAGPHAPVPVEQPA